MFPGQESRELPRDPFPYLYHAHEYGQIVHTHETGSPESPAAVAELRDRFRGSGSEDRGGLQRVPEALTRIGALRKDWQFQAGLHSVL